MQYTIEELKRNIFQKVYEVYEVFKNFFGEEHVDLQGLPDNIDLLSLLSAWGIRIEKDQEVFEIPNEEYQYIVRSCDTDFNPFLLVWWPSVVVTNENNHSIVIQDLYAEIKLTKDGRIPYEYVGFNLNRATYSNEQFFGGYMHSHVTTIDKRPLREFKRPCLGTGPIQNTILGLKNNFDEIKWMLFCQELSLYVTVESLKGGPYIKMESVGASQLTREYIGYSENFLNGLLKNLADEICLKYFIKWYLQNGHLSLSYQGGFIVGMPYYNYMMDVSNAFITWFNQYGGAETLQKLHHYHFLNKVRPSQGLFYYLTTDEPDSYAELEGSALFQFKGKDITLHIEPPTQDQSLGVCTLLHHDVAMHILGCILKTVNYWYKNEHTNSYSRKRQEESTTTAETVSFL